MSHGKFLLCKKKTSKKSIWNVLSWHFKTGLTWIQSEKEEKRNKWSGRKHFLVFRFSRFLNG